MKFGALLRESSNETPELQNLYSCYKLLKKGLKRLPDRHNVEVGADDPAERAAIAERQHSFVMILNEDVQQFNELFIEKEEESVIRLRSLEDAAEGAQHNMEATGKVFKSYVDFHGKMLLLVHWSILAYTGLVKILKKHHKRTGLLVRAPHLDNLLSQPFCSVELMSQLVHKAERDINSLAAQLRSMSHPAGAPAATAAAALSGSSPLPSGLGAVNDLIHAARSSVEQIAQHRDEPASSSEEENSVDAAEEQPGAEGVVQPHEADGEVQGLAACSLPQQEALQPRQKRHLSRSLDLSRGSVSSRAAKHQKQDDGSVQYLAAPVDPAELAAATLAHQASLDMSGLKDAQPRQVLSGRDAGSLNQRGAPLNGSSHSQTAAAVRPAAQPLLVHAAGAQSQHMDEAGSQAWEGPVEEQPPSILRQTEAALGLWEQLHVTASTPSTVLPPQNARATSAAAFSASTDQSAA